MKNAQTQTLDEIISELNNAIASDNTCKVYKLVISEKNKAIILRSKAIKTLEEKGVKGLKPYTSYNANPLKYNALEKTLKALDFSIIE